MKSLLLIGLNQKEQIRTKAFLEKDYQVETKVSMHDGVEQAIQKNFDLFLYDVDNTVPLKYFHQELKKHGITTPIVVLSRKTEATELKGLRALGAVALIKKTYNKKRLLQGIHDGFRTSQFLTKKQDTANNSNQCNKATIFMGLRQSVMISRLHENGLNLLSTTSLDLGTRINLNNTDLCNFMGFADHSLLRIELVVRMCAQVSEHKFKIEAAFSETTSPEFKHFIKKFIVNDIPSSKTISASFIKVHLKTQMVVMCREQIRLLHVTENGLVFLRPTPIASGTKLFIKSSMIPAPTTKGSHQAKIQVTQCERHKQRPIYIVQTSFFKGAYAQ